MIQMLGLQPDSNFLDVKCADGQVTTEFAGGFYGLRLARTKNNSIRFAIPPPAHQREASCMDMREKVGKPKKNR